jgi:transcription elongation GreA/GreB family factor
MSSKTIKEHLLLSCEQQIMQNYSIVQDKIKGIVASLANATKSSAGDKHQTARAMLQIDREQAGERLVEIEKTLEILHKIYPTNTATHAHLGSLVTTNNGNFFLSISLGAVTHQKTCYYCIGLQTPIGKLLFGKKEGDTFCFRETTYKIKAIE